MKRRLINTLLVVPALLLALSLYSWGRSYLPADTHVRSHQGMLCLIFTEGSYTRMMDPTNEMHRGLPGVLSVIRSARSYVTWRGVGCEVIVPNPAASSRGAIVAVHYGWIVLTLAAVSGWCLLILRRRRRLGMRGRCGRCGYDVRASSGRCPECGEEIRDGADSGARAGVSDATSAAGKPAG